MDADFVPPEHHRTIAKHVAESWPRRPKIEVWSAKTTSARQAIAILKDSPKKGHTAYSTVGLCDAGGYEIATAAKTKNRSFIKALFDVASFAIDGTRRIKWGVVFEKVVARYYTRAETGHLYLSRVALPGLEIADVETDAARVRWLYAWPVTSDELKVLEEQGRESFDGRLRESDGMDIFDFGRPAFPGVPRFDPWTG